MKVFNLDLDMAMVRTLCAAIAASFAVASYAHVILTSCR